MVIAESHRDHSQIAVTSYRISETIDTLGVRVIQNSKAFRISRFRLDEEGQREDVAEFAENDQAYDKCKFLPEVIVIYINRTMHSVSYYYAHC